MDGDHDVHVIQESGKRLRVGRVEGREPVAVAIVVVGRWHEVLDDGLDTRVEHLRRGSEVPKVRHVLSGHRALALLSPGERVRRDALNLRGLDGVFRRSEVSVRRAVGADVDDRLHDVDGQLRAPQLVPRRTCALAGAHPERVEEEVHGRLARVAAILELSDGERLAARDLWK